MMSPVVVMVTVSERLELLNGFLASLARYGDVRDVAIHMQGEALAEDDIDLPDSLNLVHYRHSHERMGCHAARIVLLRDLEGRGYDTYVNVDDDVVLTRHTHWGPAMDKAHEPGVGFVLTNWVKSVKAMPKAIDIMGEEFVRQAMVYNGGGMAYSEDVAALIRELEPVPARYDDLWPLTAYLAGYQNLRYRGSLAIHTIMAKGGMNAYMRSEPRPLLGWDWIDYKPLPGAAVGSDYSIPMDADLRPAAKAQHQRARAERGWA